jgi:ubiquinone/menaquinone biosynthesis C-methylase UbiE
MNEEFFDANLKRWNELVGIHYQSELYEVKEFLQGKNKLNSIELEELGPVKDQTMLHLQCHFGLDSLSWARMGAKVTGVDFAPEAIKVAKELNDHLSLDAKFVQANIYSLPEVLDGSYDIVFTSYGVLCWLPDIPRWAKIIAHFLKPGGIFYIAEFHPFSMIFDEDNMDELTVRYDYFQTKEPLKFESEFSYASDDAIIENKTTFEWNHTVSEIINSLIQAGLRIEFFNEHEVTCFKQFPFTEKGEDGYYRLINQKVSIPLVFSLKATKI